MSEHDSILRGMRVAADMLARTKGDEGETPDRLTVIETLSSEIDEDVTDKMVDTVEYMVRHAKVKIELPYVRPFQNWGQ